MAIKQDQIDWDLFKKLSNFFLRKMEIIDNIIKLLILIIHRICVRAERKVDKEIINDLKKVLGKTNIVFKMAEIARLWSMTNLLDILKETELQLAFTDHFKTMATHERLDRSIIQKRLILRNGVSEVINAILRTRMKSVWREGTTTCASDSKKFGS